MADQIDVTAKKIDQGSGTKVAADIKSGEFSHRDLTAMETRLKKLSAAADSLVKQRNDLVDTIHTIANDAANQEVDKNAFLNIATIGNSLPSNVIESGKTTSPSKDSFAVTIVAVSPSSLTLTIYVPRL